MVDYKYKAFISYSWADKTWGQWILRALEQYRTPKALIGTKGRLGPVPPRLRPLFKDREEEAASARIGNVVEQALDNSEFLIVVCSPHSAESTWVNREIAYFKTNRNPDKVLTLVIDGEPGASRGSDDPEQECFPAAILHQIDSAGQITNIAEELPLAADARPQGDGKRNAKLKIAAAILGVGLDELVRREDRRRANQRLAVTAVTSAIALVTTGLAITAAMARDEAVAAKAIADERRVEAEGLVEFMITDMRDRLRAVNRLDVLDMTAQRTLEYYAKQDPGSLDPDALGRRARAMLLFGEVHNSKGNLDEALAAYREAADTTAEQMRRDPDNPQRIFDHSQSVFWVGFIAYQRGDRATANDYWSQYHEQAQRLVDLDPDNEDWRAELLYAHSNLGTLAFDDSDAEQAEYHFSKALDLTKALFGEQPDTVQGVIDLGQSYSWLGEALYLQTRIAEAQATRRAELALYEASRELVPDHAVIKTQETVARYSLAQFLLASGDISDSVQMAESAILLAEDIFEAEPQNLERAGYAALANTIAGEGYMHSGQLAKARKSLTRAISIGEKLTAADDSVVKWKGKIRVLPTLRLAQVAEREGFTEQALLTYKDLTRSLAPMLSGETAEVVHVYCEASAGQARLSNDPDRYYSEIVSILPSDAGAGGIGIQSLRASALVKTGKTTDAALIASRLYQSGYRHPDFMALLEAHPDLLPGRNLEPKRPPTPP